MKLLLTSAAAMLIAAPTFAQDKMTLLLDWFINPDHGPIIVAEELGLFADQGLEVEIIPPADPSAPPKLVAAGQGDIAVSYQPSQHLAVAEGLPLIRIGKFDRTALPEPTAKAPVPDTAPAPAGSTEDKLTHIWAAVLERDDFARTDNFFDIGGHSLRVTQLASRSKRDLGADLPLRTVFENPTVAGLVRLIDADQTPAEQAAAPAPARKGGIKPIARSARQRKRTTGA